MEEDEEDEEDKEADRLNVTVLKCAAPDSRKGRQSIIPAPVKKTIFTLNFQFALKHTTP